MRPIQLVQSFKNVNFFNTHMLSVDFKNTSNMAYLDKSNGSKMHEDDQEFFNNIHIFNKYVNVDNMVNVDFVCCDMDKIKFSSINIDNSLFMNVNITSSGIRNCNIRNTSFIDSKFIKSQNYTGNIIDGSTFDGCIFENIDFGGVFIYDSYFGSCTFINCKNFNYREIQSITTKNCKFVDDKPNNINTNIE